MESFKTFYKSGNSEFNFCLRVEVTTNMGTVEIGTFTTGISFDVGGICLVLRIEGRDIKWGCNKYNRSEGDIVCSFFT